MENTLRLKDFEAVTKLAEEMNYHLVIDNNRGGTFQVARWNKSFLSRKLNASGIAWVHILKPYDGTLRTFKERHIDTIIFEYE